MIPAERARVIWDVLGFASNRLMASPEYGAVESGSTPPTGSDLSSSRPEGHVDWNYEGKTDIAVGTSATLAERLLTFGAGLVGIIVIICLRYIYHYKWAWWQTLIAVLLAFDIFGGTIGLATNSSKRFFFTPTKPDETDQVHFLKNHTKFTAIHVHPLLVWLLYPPHSWLFGVLWYLYLQVAVLIVGKATPLYLRRPIAFCFIVLAIFLNQYIIRPVHGFEWLGPLMTLKIVYGHTVQEEPYRPARV